MSTDLTRIGERARKTPEIVFTSLYHHVTDVDNLRDCYEALDDDKAVGVDGVTKEQYGKNLEENLQNLSDRLKRMGYRPQSRRRSYIPKLGSEKGRPLGISCFEDKIVELAVKRVLEPIYEEIFEDSSYGYRPGRSQHSCLDKLGRTIQQKRVNHVVGNQAANRENKLQPIATEGPGLLDKGFLSFFGEPHYWRIWQKVLGVDILKPYHCIADSSQHNLCMHLCNEPNVIEGSYDY